MTIFRKPTGWLAVVVGAALLIGGVAVASNMGFKYTTDIPANDAFNLSLPWNNNYTTAEELRNDLGADRVSKVRANASFQNWFPGSFGNNFDVAPQEAYVVTAGGTAIQEVVVGSHDPNATIDFAADEAKNVASPYHQTLTTANDLFQDIESQLGTGTVDRVSKIRANASFQNWFPGSFGNNFDLQLGMGVVVFAKSTAGGYQYPHY
jgi:hypothetical protein